MPSIYDFPRAYDAILDRPRGVVDREVESIHRLLASHGIAEGKVLELACGACAHGIQLARHGYRVTGIDRSSPMLAEARRRAVQAEVDLRTFEGNVVDFDLGEADFDAAVFMFETFPLITEYDAIASHFAAVRRHLRRGGIYTVDLDAYGHGIRSEAGKWGRRTVSFPGGTAETWYEDLPGNWVTGTNRLVLHCRIWLAGQLHETRDDWLIRSYTPWELALLARALPGWRLDGLHSWRDLGTDISRETHYFAVFEAD